MGRAPESLMATVDVEALLDAPRLRIVREMGAHLRQRLGFLALCATLAFVGGFPAAGAVLKWMLAQPNLLPADVMVSTLHPMEALILQLRLATHFAVFVVLLVIVVELTRLAARNPTLREVELPPWTGQLLARAGMILALALGLAGLGLLYAWEVLMPFILDYLHGDALEAGLSPMWRLESWAGFIAGLALGSAIAFEVPLIVLLVLRGGLASRDVLTTYRRHIWFCSAVVAAVLSPPDPLSLLLFAGPMVLLFELALVLDRLVPQRA